MIRPRRARHTAAVVTLGALLLGATAGCSGARGYEVPAELCGVPADTGRLSPLLPDGDAIEQKENDLGQGSRSCRLSVDSRQVLYVRADVVPADTDPVKVNEHALIGLGNPQPAGIGDDARIADKGALAVVACPADPQKRKFVLEADLATKTPEDTADRRRALTRFLEAYLPQALKKRGCTA